MALFFVLSLAATAKAADGPYLHRAETGGWVAQWIEPAGDGERVRREPVSAGAEIAVPAVGRLPAFAVRLRDTAPVAPDRVTVPTGAPLLVVADTHGEYEILVELLQRHGVIDQRLHWSFGRGHLAFLGDVFDRGAHQTEILWLIYKLEAEAAASGGGVHLLLGNHEIMVLRGDERYLNPKYRHTAERLGGGVYADLFDGDSLLGQWLRSRATVLQADDLLLVHGGVSPECVGRGLTPEQVNRAVREVLAGAADPEASDLHGFVVGPRSPVWYRGYFPGRDAPPESSAADVDAVLRHFGVRTVLVGHTPVPHVTALYDGAVIAVQVYPKRDESSGQAVMEAALLEDGRWHRVAADGTRTPLVPDPA